MPTADHAILHIRMPMASPLHNELDFASAYDNDKVSYEEADDHHMPESSQQQSDDESVDAAQSVNGHNPDFHDVDLNDQSSPAVPTQESLESTSPLAPAPLFRPEPLKRSSVGVPPVRYILGSEAARSSRPPLGRLGMSSPPRSLSPEGQKAHPSVRPLSNRSASAESTSSSDMHMIVSNENDGTFETVDLSHKVELTREKLGKTTLDGFGHRARSPARSSSPVSRKSTPPIVGGKRSTSSLSRHSAGPEAGTSRQPTASTSRSSLDMPQTTTTPKPISHDTNLSSPSSPKARKPRGAPTALQKVVSKTRQRDLPPKHREEDSRHLKEFNDMMHQSKKLGAAFSWCPVVCFFTYFTSVSFLEKKKVARIISQRSSKDVEIALHLPTWEKEVLPNWRVVQNNPVRFGPYPQSLW